MMFLSPAQHTAGQGTPVARQRRSMHQFLLPAALALLLAACNNAATGDNGGGNAPAGGGQDAASRMPPPPEVGVVTVRLAPIGMVVDLPGRIEASRVAEIRARAAGILEKRLFKEGSDVKEGQLLFRIDAAPYEAALNSARAGLARARTQVSNSKQVVDRYTPLIKANAVSRQEYDNAVAAYRQAQADVAVAQASVKTAAINLSYANVTSPISGRIGRALVTEGALVGQGAATPLATVQQIDPVYVNITQSATAVMQLRRGLKSGQLKQADERDGASVRIRFDDGSIYEHRAVLLFTDLTVDPGTNQVALRAEVPNPRGDLLPGMYVRAELEQAEIPRAILLPQQAVTRSSTGNTVTVIAADGSLSQRQVSIGSAHGADWIVLDGLKDGEQVMVDGFQKLQMMGPVNKVKAVPWKNAVSSAQPDAGKRDEPSATAPGNDAASQTN